MSGNKLLAENTIRRFMKLASVDTMTDNFISEMGVKYRREDLEEEVEETNEETVTEEEETELSSELGSEEPEEEMEIDMGEPAMDAEPEMGAADMSLTEEEAQLLIDLGSRLAEAMGGEVDAASADDAEPEMDMEPEMAMEPEAEEEDEDPMMQEALVNEVLKRVTKRIVATKLQNRK